MIAHVQAVAIAQGHIGQVGGVDLDDGNIVVLIATDILGVIAVAVIKGNLHGVRVTHHMVVGDDIAVRGQDEAGTGACRLGGLTEEVGVRGGGDVDGHHAVGIGGVQLRIGHGGLAVHGLDLDLRGLAVGNVHLGGVAPRMIACQIDGAAAHQAAQQGAHQSQGRNLQAHPVFAALGLLVLDLRLLGRLLLLLAVAVDLVVHAGLLGVIALARLRAVLAVGVVIQVVFIVIHKSNLLGSVRLKGFRLELP